MTIPESRSSPPFATAGGDELIFRWMDRYVGDFALLLTIVTNVSIAVNRGFPGPFSGPISTWSRSSARVFRNAREAAVGQANRKQCR